MEQRFKKMLLILEGTTEEVSHSTLLLKSIYDKNICFDEQKCVAWKWLKGLNNKQPL
jgi:hypothetical protein